MTLKIERPMGIPIRWMIVVIVAGSLGGKYADQHFQLGFPIFTLLGVIFSVFAALYLAVKDFLKK